MRDEQIDLIYRSSLARDLAFNMARAGTAGDVRSEIVRFAGS